MKKNAQIKDTTKLPMDLLIKQATEVLIANELLFQKAREKKIQVSQKELDSELETLREDTPKEEFELMIKKQGADMDVYKNSILKTLYIRKLVMSEMPAPAKPFDEVEVRKTYDLYKEKMIRPVDTIRLSHIFIESKENDTPQQAEVEKKTIEKIKKELDTDNKKWNELAKKYSNDKISSDKGGDIGYFPAQPFPFEIDNESIPTKVGQITKVIKSYAGYHVVKLTDRQNKGGILSYEEARPSIIQAMMERKSMEFFNKYVAELKKQAKIETFVK